ncbi:hypothetical protein DPMN_135299 [Dreissena polymorpha]|uniref:Uncharacterized protein n=1 Tax=Dreissena polymorpha TaxID=45954 RepID=A0A9D4G0P4_DREPO|nr:hypothetical protein DPMN_135299 [Dreissena polymorpha]
MGHACAKFNMASQCHRFRSKCRRRYANWPVLASLPHNRSLKSRLSLGVGEPKRRNLADLCAPMGHECAKFNMASQCHRFR